MLLLVAPLLGVYPVFLMKLLCFALFACAFNLLLGFTGLLSFGHAAFFGGAAYATGWFIKAQHLSPELGILAGMVSVTTTSWFVSGRNRGTYAPAVVLARALAHQGRNELGLPDLRLVQAGDVEHRLVVAFVRTDAEHKARERILHDHVVNGGI
ncbi:MAG: hypothetical protein ABIR55_13075, partial [Burkholderiaceae bacterium]